MKRTDMAVEFAERASKKGVSLSEEEYAGVRATRVEVNRVGASLIGKPAGNYITLHCADDDETSCSLALTHYLGELIKRISVFEKIMVVGLGNPSVTPDSLGAQTVRKIPATAHLSQTEEFSRLKMRSVVVIETGVLAKTGLETSDRLRYISEKIDPSAIIVIDSLACTDFSRLGKTIQLTDTGIAPGSGVDNSRSAIDERTMGAKVIAVGVPTVMDLQGEAEKIMMITPRDIDIIIKRCSKIISAGINSALNPYLTLDEINQLLF